MSEPFVAVTQIAVDRPQLHLVSIKLSAQSAADVLAVMKQAWTGSCDANLNQAAFNELVHQLMCLKALPEPTRCE